MKHINNFLRKYGSYLLLIVILIFFVAYIEPITLYQHLRRITLSLIFWFFVIYAIAFLIRSARWKILLNACGATPKLRYLWTLIHSVWFVNMILPARMGEAMRLKIVEEEFHVDAGITIGTVIIEHLLDFLVLIGFVGISSYAVAGIFLTNPTALIVLRGAVVFVGIILLIVLLILITGHKILSKLSFLPQNLRERLFQVYFSLKASLRLVIQDKLRFVGAIILSIILWSLETATIFLIVRGIGLQVSYEICLLSASIGYLTFAAPLTPGNLGTFELTTASFLNISSKVNLEDTLVVPLIDRALKTLYLVCLGIPFFFYHGLTLSPLKTDKNK